MQNSEKSGIGIIIAIIVGRWLLDYSLYSKGVYHSSELEFIISWLILGGSFYFIDTIFTINKPFKSITDYVFQIIYVCSFVPFTSCLAAGWFKLELTCLLFVYWCALGYLFSIKKRIINVPFNDIMILDKLSNKWVCRGIITISIAIIVYINITYTGGRIWLELTSPEDIYFYRLQAREYNLSPWLEGLYSWAKVSCTLLLAYYFKLKKWVLMCLCMFGLYMSFCINADKGYILMATISLLVIMSYRYIPKVIFNTLTAYVLPIICSFSYINLVWNLGIRRFMLDPMDIHVSYYDFFSIHEFDFFRSGFLRHFGFNVPYPDGIYRTIGRIYYNPDNAANNGLFSDAFANLGYAGIIILPIIIFLILMAFDYCASNLSNDLKYVISFLLAIFLISGGIVTIIIMNASIMMVLTFAMSAEQRNKDNMGQMIT